MSNNPKLSDLTGETGHDDADRPAPYSRNTRVPDDRVIVAETASDIQPAIDALDGEQTGYDDTDSPQRPGGGVVLLKRKKYAPSSPILLKTGVELRGLQPDHRQGRQHHEWSYCEISGENLAAGDPIIETDASVNTAEHAGVRNVVINGTGNAVTGVRVWNTANFLIEDTIIERCGGHGFRVRGGLDTYVNNSIIQGGDYTEGTYALYVESEGGSVGSGGDDTQLRVDGQTRIKSSGTGSGDNGHYALRNESSLVWVTGWCSIVTRNENAPSPATAAVYNNSAGTPLILGGLVTITGTRQTGVDGIHNDGNMHLDNVKVEKVDRGIVYSGKRRSQWSNVRIKQCSTTGLEINGSTNGTMGAVSNMTVRDCGGDGIEFAGGSLGQPWEQIRLEDNGGYGFNITGGQRNDVQPIDSLRHTGNTSGLTNAPEQLIVNGLGQESASAEEPTASYYPAGTVVEFTDTGDGSGTGLYLLMRDGTTWREI